MGITGRTLKSQGDNIHLAQLNIGKVRFNLESPEMADFVNNLDPINAIAEQSPGFIWRLKDESGDATNIKLFDDPNMIINMSVWERVEDLKNFMFRTHHRDFMRRKGEWFHRLAEDSYVLWWIEDNHIPTPQEALERLQNLRENGDTPHNFTAEDLGG